MTPHPLDDPALHDRIRRVAAGMRGQLPRPDSDEDEVTQRLTEVVLRRLYRFNPSRGPIEPFVTMAAGSAARGIVRHAYQAKRDPKRVQLLDDVGPVTVPAAEASRLEHDDQRSRITRALSRLDEPDRQFALHIMRFGVNHACKRLGLTRSQRVQALERIGLTLQAENLGNYSTKSRNRTRDGVSDK